MPYLDPPTAALNAKLPSADWNAYIRDNDRWFAHDPTGGAPAGRVYNTAAQVGISSGTTLAWDAFDINRGGAVLGSSPNFSLSAPAAGLYQIGAACRLRSTYDGSGNGAVRLELFLDAGTPLIVDEDAKQAEITAAREYRLRVSTLVNIATAGMLITARITYINQASVDVLAVGSSFAQVSPALWARWVGLPE